MWQLIQDQVTINKEIIEEVENDKKCSKKLKNVQHIVMFW